MFARESARSGMHERTLIKGADAQMCSLASLPLGRSADLRRDRRCGALVMPEVLPPLRPGLPGRPLQHIVRFSSVNNLFACSWVTGSGQVHRPLSNWLPPVPRPCVVPGMRPSAPRRSPRIPRIRRGASPSF
jgi:hypothetical protein